jgi:hypothetical protein
VKHVTVNADQAVVTDQIELCLEKQIRACFTAN